MNKALLILSTLTLLTASASALDIKSSDLTFFGVDGLTDFTVSDTVFKLNSLNLNLNGNNISNVDTINGENASNLGGDGYIGDAESHVVGGSLDMDGNSVSNVSGLSGGCPSRYVWVPGSSKFGTMPGFCVMKYEAKDDGSGNPISQPENSPWVNINQYTAKQECRSLGKGYHMVNEREWMTMAYQIANNPNNWADGTIGSQVSNSGGLYRGNVGITDSVSVDEPNPDNATSPGSKEEEVRTLQLSNGNSVWDLSGNAWEWTSTRIYTHNGAHESPQQNESNGDEGWNELTEVTDWRGLSESRPPRGIWNSSHGIGKIRTNGDDTIGPDGEVYLSSGVLRGGSWFIGDNAGLFEISLNVAPPKQLPSVGFRCSFAPVS